MRTSTIFKSRWWALIWSAGIIWFALDYAGSGKPATNSAATNAEASAENTGTGITDVTGQPVSNEDLAEFEKAINGM